MNEKKYVDAKYIELNENKNTNDYYSLNEVVDILNVDKVKILYWCNKFKTLLKIQSIGEYLLFDNIDMQNLKKIKELNIDKGLNIEETKKYIEENENSITIKENTLPEQSILPILIQILKSQDQKMNLMSEELTKMSDKIDGISNQNTLIIENQKEYKKEKDLNLEEIKKIVNSLDKKINSSNLDNQEKNKELIKEVQYISGEITNRREQKNKKKGILNNIKNIFGI